MKASYLDQERLLALQQIDSDILKINHKIKSSPLNSQLDGINRELSENKNLLIAAETEKSDIQHELSKSEIDVEQVISRIEKDEKRLASGGGTPKELEQIQHELGTLARRRSELEDIELEIMVRIEEVSSRVQAIKEKISVLESDSLKLQSDLSLEKNQLDSAKQQSLAARDVLAPQINNELIALYEKIRSASDGVGAAQLLGESCGGCHLKLNAAEIERVKSLPDDELVRCEECRRILIRVK
ncbi:MAG TPA: C4-type zinc ribbon domain-containing protein [Candidatus Nanopelagicaceae bacterium]